MERIEDMIKTCPHGTCGSKDLPQASYHECATCGRMVCLANGCFCSDYQAKNPIRDGVGMSVHSKAPEGRWVTTYPYATEGGAIKHAALIASGR